ncbi:TPA: sugar phosphate nucleotidyltransferase [Streptococcus pneumoniae]
MKIDKYSAILGNTVGFHNMSTLTDHRPVASLPFGGKYRLIDFPLSSLANAGVRSVFGIFQQDNISSVFDHIRSGREWGLSTLLSHYYLGIYNTRVESSTVGKEYYQQLLTYLKRSGSNQTVALNCDVLINIDLNQVFHLHSTTKLRYVLRDLAVKEGAFAYEYTGYLANIHSVKSYYQANIDMLESQKFYSLFSPNQKIYTKVKNEEPTYYANTSKVSTSQFASGSIIEGQVANSVLSRNIHVHKDSLVKDSLLFPRVVIGKGAQVEYAILDKGVEVEPGVVIRGTAEHPVVVKKGAKVTEDIHS